MFFVSLVDDSLFVVGFMKLGVGFGLFIIGYSVFSIVFVM